MPNDRNKKKRREVFLSDKAIEIAHNKAGLTIESGNKGNRNKAIEYCIESAPNKAIETAAITSKTT